MFCKKCGRQIRDNEKFCPKCGTPVVKMTPSDSGGKMPEGGTYQPGHGVVENRTSGGTTPRKRLPYLGVGAMVIVALILFSIIRGLFFTGNYETPVKNMFKAMETGNGKLLLSVIPDKVIREIAKENGISTKELKDTIKDDIKNEFDGVRVKIKYEIKDQSKMKKSEITELEERYENVIHIKEGKYLEVAVELYINGTLEQEETQTLDVIKVGRKWYIDLYNFDFYL